MASLSRMLSLMLGTGVGQVRRRCTEVLSPSEHTDALPGVRMPVDQKPTAALVPPLSRPHEKRQPLELSEAHDWTESPALSVLGKVTRLKCCICVSQITGNASVEIRSFITRV